MTIPAGNEAAKGADAAQPKTAVHPEIQEANRLIADLAVATAVAFAREFSALLRGRLTTCLLASLQQPPWQNKQQRRPGRACREDAAEIVSAVAPIIVAAAREAVAEEELEWLKDVREAASDPPVDEWLLAAIDERREAITRGVMVDGKGQQQ